MRKNNFVFINFFIFLLIFFFVIISYIIFFFEYFRLIKLFFLFFYNLLVFFFFKVKLSIKKLNLYDFKSFFIIYKGFLDFLLYPFNFIFNVLVFIYYFFFFLKLKFNYFFYLLKEYFYRCLGFYFSLVYLLIVDSVQEGNTDYYYEHMESNREAPLPPLTSNYYSGIDFFTSSFIEEDPELIYRTYYDYYLLTKSRNKFISNEDFLFNRNIRNMEFLHKSETYLYNEIGDFDEDYDNELDWNSDESYGVYDLPNDFDDWGYDNVIFSYGPDTKLGSQLYDLTRLWPDPDHRKTSIFTPTNTGVFTRFPYEFFSLFQLARDIELVNPSFDAYTERELWDVYANPYDTFAFDETPMYQYLNQADQMWSSRRWSEEILENVSIKPYSLKIKFKKFNSDRFKILLKDDKVVYLDLNKLFLAYLNLLFFKKHLTSKIVQSLFELHFLQNKNLIFDKIFNKSFYREFLKSHELDSLLINEYKFAASDDPKFKRIYPGIKKMSKLSSDSNKSITSDNTLINHPYIKESNLESIWLQLRLKKFKKYEVEILPKSYEFDMEKEKIVYIIQPNLFGKLYYYYINILVDLNEKPWKVKLKNNRFLSDNKLDKDLFNSLKLFEKYFDLKFLNKRRYLMNMLLIKQNSFYLNQDFQCRSYPLNPLYEGPIVDWRTISGNSFFLNRFERILDKNYYLNYIRFNRYRTNIRRKLIDSKFLPLLNSDRAFYIYNDSGINIKSNKIETKSLNYTYKNFKDKNLNLKKRNKFFLKKIIALGFSFFLKTSILYLQNIQNRKLTLPRNANFFKVNRNMEDIFLNDKLFIQRIMKILFFRKLSLFLIRKLYKEHFRIKFKGKKKLTTRRSTSFNYRLWKLFGVRKSRRRFRIFNKRISHKMPKYYTDYAGEEFRVIDLDSESEWGEAGWRWDWNLQRRYSISPPRIKSGWPIKRRSKRPLIFSLVYKKKKK